MPLVNTGLIVRYYVDEAASGAAPTDVLDASGVGTDFDLTLNYGVGGDDMAYVEIATGRGIEKTVATGSARAAKDINDTSDKVRDAIHGAQTATFELVCKVSSAVQSSGGRLFGISTAGTSVLDIQYDSDATEAASIGGTGAWKFTFNNVNHEGWTTAEDTRLVMHVVLDTTQAAAGDRVKIYIDGTLLTSTSIATITQNATVSVGAGSALLMFERDDLNRDYLGACYYAALYSSAFSSTDVTTNYTILTADDDTPAGGGGGFQAAWAARSNAILGAGRAA